MQPAAGARLGQVALQDGVPQLSMEKIPTAFGPALHHTISQFKVCAVRLERAPGP